MNAASPSYTSLEDYVTGQEAFDWHREWCDGVVYDMPRSSIERARIIASVGAALGHALDGVCAFFASSAMLWIDGAQLSTYASVTGVRGKLARKRLRCADGTAVEWIENPSLIVEVLSEDSERYERDGKFQAYKQLASLEEYVLVSPHEPAIEVYRRSAERSWACETAGTGGSVTIHGKKLAVNDVYAKASRR